MLNWLKRKRQKAKDGDLWTVATGEDRGFPLILRVRSTPPPGISKSEYPTLLAIHWDYRPSRDGGMPSSEEKTLMDQLEDLLKEGLESENQSYLTAVVTCNGVREWQWYTRDPQETVSLINSTLAEHTPFPIQISAQED